MRPIPKQNQPDLLLPKRFLYQTPPGVEKKTEVKPEAVDVKAETMADAIVTSKARMTTANLELRKSGVEFNDSAQNELNTYFRNSIDRFDKDKDGKVDAGEAAEYKKQMAAKVEELIQETKPDSDLNKKREAAAKAAEAAGKAPEAAKPLGEVKEIADNLDLQGTLKEFEGMQEQNSSFQASVADQMKGVQTFQTNFSTYEATKQGFVNAVGRLGNRLNPFSENADEVEANKLRSALESLKTQVSGKLTELKSKKTTLEGNATKINASLSRERTRIMKERDDKVKELEEKKTKQGETIKERQEKKKQVEEQIKKTEGRRSELQKKLANQSQFKQRWEEDNKANRYEDRRKGFESSVEDNKQIVEGIQMTLQNPNLTPEAKTFLEAQLTAATDRQKTNSTNAEMLDKRVVANGVIEGQLTEDEKVASEQVSSADAHLTKTLNPTLSALDTNIVELEKLKVQYATEAVDVTSFYNKRVDEVNKISEQVSDSTLKSAIARNKGIDSMQTTLDSLNKVNVEVPGFLKSVVLGPIQGVFHDIGRGLAATAKWIDSNTRTAINLTDSTFGKVALNVGGFFTGFLSGGLELIGGVSTMIAHPVDTVKGMGALIGRDPTTAEWSWEMLGNSWKHLGSALVGGEEIEHGSYGAAAGKLVFNVLSMFVGAGEAGAGAKAAAASTLARDAAIASAKLAGKEVGMFTGRLAEFGAFSKTLAVQGAKGVGKGIVELPGNIAKGAKNLGSGLADAVKGTSTVTVDAAKLAGKEMPLTYKIGAGAVDAIKYTVQHPIKAVGKVIAAPFKVAFGAGELLIVRPIKAIARGVEEIPKLFNRIKGEGLTNVWRARKVAGAAEVVSKEGAIFNTVRSEAAEIVAKDPELAKLAAQGSEGAKLAEIKAIQRISETKPGDVAAYLRVEEAANTVQEGVRAVAEDSLAGAKKMKAEPGVAEAGKTHEALKAKIEGPANTPGERAAQAKAKTEFTAMEADTSQMDKVKKYQTANQVEQEVGKLLGEQDTLFKEYAGGRNESLVKLDAEVAEARNPTVTKDPSYINDALKKYEQAVLSGEEKAIQEAQKAFGKVKKDSELSKHLKLIEDKAKEGKLIEDFQSSQKGQKPNLHTEATDVIQKGEYQIPGGKKVFGEDAVIEFKKAHPETEAQVNSMYQKFRRENLNADFRTLAKADPEVAAFRKEFEEALKNGDQTKVLDLKSSAMGEKYLSALDAMEYGYRTSPNSLRLAFRRNQQGLVKMVEDYQSAVSKADYATTKTIKDAHPEFAEAFRQLDTRNNFLLKQDQLAFKFAEQRIKGELPGLIDAKMTPQAAADKLYARYKGQRMGVAGEGVTVTENIILSDGKAYKVRLEPGSEGVRLVSQESSQPIKRSVEIAEEAQAAKAAEAAKAKPAAAIVDTGKPVVAAIDDANKVKPIPASELPAARKSAKSTAENIERLALELEHEEALYLSKSGGKKSTINSLKKAITQQEKVLAELEAGIKAAEAVKPLTAAELPAARTKLKTAQQEIQALEAQLDDTQSLIRSKVEKSKNSKLAKELEKQIAEKKGIAKDLEATIATSEAALAKPIAAPTGAPTAAPQAPTAAKVAPTATPATVDAAKAAEIPSATGILPENPTLATGENWGKKLYKETRAYVKSYENVGVSGSIPGELRSAIQKNLDKLPPTATKAELAKVMEETAQAMIENKLGPDNLAFYNKEIAAAKPAVAPTAAKAAPVTIDSAKVAPKAAPAIDAVEIQAKQAKVLKLEGDLATAQTANKAAAKLEGEVAAARAELKAAKDAQATAAIDTGIPFRNETPRPIAEVPRTHEVMSVGDLHGNGDIFVENMKSLGIVGPDANFSKLDTLTWKGGNRKVVFHGDIIADRATDSLKILEGMRKLQAEAKAAGGEITYLAGNHEMFAVDFLRGGDKGFAAFYNSWNVEQGVGLIEFIKKFSGDARFKNASSMKEVGDIIKMNPTEIEALRKSVLNNMRANPEGKAILDQLCSMKVAEYLDDTLFLHTDVTPGIVKSLDTSGATVGASVDKANAVFQQGLRDILIDDKAPAAAFDQVADTYTHTNNRSKPSLAGDKVYSYDPVKRELGPEIEVGKLQQKGVNRVVHGHSDSLAEGVRTKEGFEVVSVDRGAGKPGGLGDKGDMGERAIGVIRKDGRLATGPADVATELAKPAPKGIAAPKAAPTKAPDLAPLQQKVTDLEAQLATAKKAPGFKPTAALEKEIAAAKADLAAAQAPAVAPQVTPTGAPAKAPKPNPEYVAKQAEVAQIEKDLSAGKADLQKLETQKKGLQQKQADAILPDEVTKANVDLAEVNQKIANQKIAIDQLEQKSSLASSELDLIEIHANPPKIPQATAVAPTAKPGVAPTAVIDDAAVIAQPKSAEVLAAQEKASGLTTKLGEEQAKLDGLIAKRDAATKQYVDKFVDDPAAAAKFQVQATQLENRIKIQRGVVERLNGEIATANADLAKAETIAAKPKAANAPKEQIRSAKAEVLDAQLEVRTAEMEVKMARAEVDSAKAALDKVTSSKSTAGKAEINKAVQQLDAAEAKLALADLDLSIARGKLVSSKDALSTAKGLDRAEMVKGIKEFFTKPREIKSFDSIVERLGKVPGDLGDWAKGLIEDMRAQREAAKSGKLSIFREKGTAIANRIQSAWAKLGKGTAAAVVTEDLLKEQLIMLGQINKVAANDNAIAIASMSPAVKLQEFQNGLKKVAANENSGPEQLFYTDSQIEFASGKRELAMGAISDLNKMESPTQANVIEALNSKLGAETNGTGQSYSLKVDGITVNIAADGKRTYDNIEKWVTLVPAKKAVGSVYKEYANNYAKIFNKAEVKKQEKALGHAMTMEEYRAAVEKSMAGKIAPKIGDKKDFEVFSLSRTEVGDHPNFTTTVNEKGEVSIKLSDEWIEKSYAEVVTGQPASKKPVPATKEPPASIDDNTPVA